MSTPKKKLYISCPMKGRTEEAIRHDMDRMHRVAEAVFDQELEVIPTYVKHDPPETGNKAIWCLGESVKKMSEADYFIGMHADGFHGCEVEGHVARAYGIPRSYLDREALMPDVIELERNHADRYAGVACTHMPVCG